ncbi:hypothetical protein E0I03_01730 [Dickeya dadantii]|nr:hypothetical protein [Dickeya dadantii]
MPNGIHNINHRTLLSLSYDAAGYRKTHRTYGGHREYGA